MTLETAATLKLGASCVIGAGLFYGSYKIITKIMNERRVKIEDLT